MPAYHSQHGLHDAMIEAGCQLEALPGDRLGSVAEYGNKIVNERLSELAKPLLYAFRWIYRTVLEYRIVKNRQTKINVEKIFLQPKIEKQ